MTINGSFSPDRRGLNPAKKRLYESKELGDMLQRIVRHAEILLGVHHCSVTLLDSSETSLITMAALPDVGQKVSDNVIEIVVGWVLEHHEVLLQNDLSTDGRLQHLNPAPSGSILCIPLFDAGRCIGTLTTSDVQPKTFDPQKIQMLLVLAEQAQLTILYASQMELLQYQTNQIEAQMHLVQSMTARLKPEELYRTILSNVRRLLSCERATILLYHAESQTLSVVAEWSLANASSPTSDDNILTFTDDSDTHQKRDRISIHDMTSLAAWAAAHMHLMLGGSMPPQMVAEEESETGSVPHELALPLVSNKILYGVLSLERQEEPFSSDELRLIRNLGSLVAATLEQHALFFQMRGEQEQLRTIRAASSDGIALLGGNNRVIEANASFERIFGLQTDQVVGMPCQQLLASGEEGDLHAEERQKIQLALDQNQLLSYIEIDLPLQGAPHTIGLSLTPISTAHDDPLSLLIVRDVTAIRDVARTKSKFLSLVTHELRSPLNAINGYLDLTLNDVAGEINEQQREFLQRARSGSEHLYALLEDLLLIARADAGQLVLNRQVISLNDLVDNAVEEFDLTAVDSKVQVEVEMPQRSLHIYADAVRIQQVLRNLLSNALRFTPEGGHVHISVQAVDWPAADPDENGRALQLQIRDTGSGIAPEFLERIFERFYQIPPAQGGQGLGLAVVKMIVEMHGGSVTVKSVPGESSTFTCIMPILLS